jgi:HEPN domain-containing protein
VRSHPAPNINLTLVIANNYLIITFIMKDEQKNLINYLEPLYIEARYADYKAMILLQMTREYSQQLVTQTEEFLSWIKKRLSE